VRVYIAASYARHADLQPVKRSLDTMGHKVVSRWLERSFKTIDDGRKRDWATPSRMADEAAMDFTDVTKCDTFVLEGAPEGTCVRGGKYVEFGVALAQGKSLHVIGHRELMFMHLPQVAFHETWYDFLAHAATRERE
jgi:hypothetical protein